MRIEISPNKLCQENHEIEFSDHVLTFIGENGCGKSSILESIFQKNLENTNGQTVVCFSSGQNESYSKFYFPFIKRARSVVQIRDEEQSLLAIDEIKTFYFDYDWSKFLIFFASILKKDGLVRDVLKVRYIDTNEAKEDITSVLSFNLQVAPVYINRINESLKIEETDPALPTLRKTDFHNQLSRLIELKIDPTYEFDKPIRKTAIHLTYNDVVNFFKKDSNSILKFLSIASTDNYFISIKESDLIFRNGIKLKDLSDGEYQLLVVKSIIDLFDGENTLFLFDEIDSHLHYKNIKRIWGVIQNNIAGKVITTTHLADSISLNDIPSLKLVENGKVIEEITHIEIFNRLDNLSQVELLKKKTLGNSKYIILMDSEFDWIVFKLFCKKKFGDESAEILSQIQFVKCPSGCDKRIEMFGTNKLNWTADFIQINKASKQTKEIFMVCDKDDFPINDIRDDLIVNINGDTKRKDYQKNKLITYLMSWKRRTIENYFLCYSIFENYGLLNENDSRFGESYKLKPGIPADNDQVRGEKVKSLIQQLYLKDGAVVLDSNEEMCIDFEKLKLVIDSVNPDEISEDIITLYNFIKERIN